MTFNAAAQQAVPWSAPPPVVPVTVGTYELHRAHVTLWAVHDTPQTLNYHGPLFKP